MSAWRTKVYVELESSCGPYISAALSSNAWHVLREFSIFEFVVFLVKSLLSCIILLHCFHTILQHQSGADLVKSHFLS